MSDNLIDLHVGDFAVPFVAHVRTNDVLDFGHRFAWSEAFCHRVVEGWKDRLLEFFNRDLENHFLVSKFLDLKIFWQGDCDLARVANIHASHLYGESW